jgi:hypothetical protein
VEAKVFISEINLIEYPISYSSWRFQLSSGNANKKSESEPQNASPSEIEAPGQLPNIIEQQKAIERSTEDLRPFSVSNSNPKDMLAPVKSTGEVGQLFKSFNHDKTSQEKRLESPEDIEQAEEGQGVQSQRISNFQQLTSEVVTERQVIDELKRMIPELKQISIVLWIKGLVVFWAARNLSGRGRAIPLWVQNIEEWERIQAEHTRQRIVHWVLGLFVAWVILGLISFALNGTIWPLLAAPVLAFPFRMAVRHYFPKKSNFTSQSISPKRWWKFWR